MNNLFKSLDVENIHADYNANRRTRINSISSSEAVEQAIKNQQKKTRKKVEKESSNLEKITSSSGPK